MADRETWCGNTLPHPPHHTCHGVVEPIIEGFSDATLCVVAGHHKSPDIVAARTLYGPTYRPYADTLTGALNRHWHSIAWETVPVADTPDLCDDLNPHPGHGDCAGLAVLTAQAAPGFSLPGAPTSTPGYAVPRRDGNRRAVVTLSRDFLAHAFGLPDGLRVVAVAVDERRDAILLKVEGDDLPDADPLAYPPEFGEATVHQLHGHEGHDWYRIEWTRQA